VFAASASSSRSSQARCSLLLDCVPVVGDVVKVAVPAGVLPPGLVGIGAENGKIPSAAGGMQTINRQNYASADKPWVGPGDLQVGRKITVNVIHSDKPEDVPVTSLPDGIEKLRENLPDSVKAQAGTLPANVVSIQLGVHKAFVTEQAYPLKRVKDKRPEAVPVSSVGIVLSPTDHILITGEGVGLAQLQALALKLEVQ